MGDSAELLILYWRSGLVVQPTSSRGRFNLNLQTMSLLTEAKMTSLKDKLEAEELERIESLKVEEKKALRVAKQAKKKKDE